MILIGLGANLPSPAGPPAATLAAALEALEAAEVVILARSHFYRTAPVPPSDQPDFINAVAAVAAALDPAALLTLLHEIEARFQRQRGNPNAARSLDLDLLAYDDRVIAGEGGLVLPHPRLHERRFVLAPLSDIAPGWRHPSLGRTAAELLAALPAGEVVSPL